MKQRAPALFIGHGSPMNAIEHNAFSQGWADVARRLARPEAIVCVSAHWVTDGVFVTGEAAPRTIHDFRGFPPELQAVQYPAPGAPALAARVAALLADYGARADTSWGFDHGAWSVLRWLYPNADVPVIQLSLDQRRAPAAHHAIGAALAPLRDEAVLILGSGNIVHNLRAFFAGQATPWAKPFDDFILERIVAGDDAAVIAYQRHPDAARAAPDWEHFTPLISVLGARGADERAHVFNRDVGTGISMTSIGFGLPDRAAA
jgi:4,5-DOPA dioxygenase extradiol